MSITHMIKEESTKTLIKNIVAGVPFKGKYLQIDKYLLTFCDPDTNHTLISAFINTHQYGIVAGILEKLPGKMASVIPADMDANDAVQRKADLVDKACNFAAWDYDSVELLKTKRYIPSNGSKITLKERKEMSKIRSLFSTQTVISFKYQDLTAIHAPLVEPKGYFERFLGAFGKKIPTPPAEHWLDKMEREKEEIEEERAKMRETSQTPTPKPEPEKPTPQITTKSEKKSKTPKKSPQSEMSDILDFVDKQKKEKQ